MAVTSPEIPSELRERLKPEIERAETLGGLANEAASWAEAYFDERAFSDRLIGAIMAREHFQRQREEEIKAEAEKVEAVIAEAERPKRKTIFGLF